MDQIGAANAYYTFTQKIKNVIQNWVVTIKKTDISANKMTAMMQIKLISVKILFSPDSEKGTVC